MSGATHIPIVSLHFASSYVEKSSVHIFLGTLLSGHQLVVQGPVLAVYRLSASAAAAAVRIVLRRWRWLHPIGEERSRVEACCG